MIWFILDTLQQKCFSSIIKTASNLKVVLRMWMLRLGNCCWLSGRGDLSIILLGLLRLCCTWQKSVLKSMIKLCLDEWIRHELEGKWNTKACGWWKRMTDCQIWARKVESGAKSCGDTSQARCPWDLIKTELSWRRIEPREVLSISVSPPKTSLSLLW